LSTGIKLHVWGEFACFTRPEMKVERVSYDVITPSAARGIIEAIYWKPEIRWRITKLHVLKPILFMSLRRNEVKSKAAIGSIDKATQSTGAVALYADDLDERQQRAATILRDVAYLIEARFDIIGGEGNPGKHLDQVNRRARAGQCFHRPYLGCREFSADFSLIEGEDEMPANHLRGSGERDLGWMLDDVVFVADPKGPIIDSNRGERWRAEPKFYRALMHDGIVDVEHCRRSEALV
jgi:CRISPR-associated protein Cas5d